MNHQRQLDIYDPATNPNAEVTMIGLGGVGSFSAVCLAKLGIPRLTLVDFDVVDDHNIPNQFYEPSQVGSYKTDALADIIQDMTGVAPATLTGKLGSQGWKPSDKAHENDLPDWSLPRGVVVSGLDSMESRQNVWVHGGVKYNPYVTRYIDVRLGGQSIVIYSLDPRDADDVKEYEKTLHDDGEAVSQSCTGRGVIDVGFQVGSLVTRQVRQHLSGEDVPNITMFGQRSLSVQQGAWV